MMRVRARAHAVPRVCPLTSISGFPVLGELVGDHRIRKVAGRTSRLLVGDTVRALSRCLSLI